LNTVTPKPPRSPFKRHRLLTILGFVLGAGIILGFATALCVVRAAPPVASGIHDDWRVWGDVQARPVQAFDDGTSLYLQLRNPSEPPAAVGPTGPLAYTMHGPYMVLPILPYLHLQYGPYRATVQSTGTAAELPGVISVTSPVEVPVTMPVPVRPLPSHPAYPAVPDATTLPAPIAPAAPVVPVSGVYGSITASPSPSNAVMGQIVATNPATGYRSAQAGGHSPQPHNSTLTWADAKAATTWNDRRGGVWVIHADGTAAGARAALDSQSACHAAKATCTIEYRGAPAGTLVISEKTA